MRPLPFSFTFIYQGKLAYYQKYIPKVQSRSSVYDYRILVLLQGELQGKSAVSLQVFQKENLFCMFLALNAFFLGQDGKALKVCGEI